MTRKLDANASTQVDSRMCITALHHEIRLRDKLNSSSSGHVFGQHHDRKYRNPHVSMYMELALGRLVALDSFSRLDVIC